MNKYIYTLLAVLVLTLTVSAGGRKDGPKKDRPAKTAVIQYDFIDVNNILMWLSNNGDMSHNPGTDGSGLEWPRGSGMNAIFQDGIIWGGTVAGQLRVGGTAYRHGLQPGPILTNGDPANPTDPKYHPFKVRKVTPETYKNLSSTDQQRLKNDYMNWPAGDGAPFTDRDGVAGYQPDFDKWLAEQDEPILAKRKVDEPFMIGDMVIWYVLNDKDPALTTYLYGSPPIGVELQILVWGYSSTGPLGNMVFTKYKLINKGTDDLLNAYISKWSDPDLGDANDDFVGVDTSLSLGYCYNGYAKDGVYGIPPATGYDFFQGPIVTSPGDTAIYNFQKKPGYRNLGVSSFAFYINSSGVYADPTQGTASGAIEMYNYQQGLLWNGNQYTDPTNGRTTKFPLYGDPISKTGWIDGVPSSPGDRRLLMTAGPFTLKKYSVPADSNNIQEVVVATIIGRGSDRISSLQVLKYYDKFAQLAFDNNFDLPKAPPSPKVDFALNDRKIIISWGNPQTANATETWNDRGYKFQGYNVYQMPTSSSLLSSAKRIATFDIIDNIATIYDNTIDDKSGALVYVPVQFGTDSDLQRQLTVKTDELTGTPLVNNQPYYYAVTAYSYNPAEGQVPAVLESSPVIYTVRPQFPNPGNRIDIHARMDSAVVVTRKGGTSSGTPIVQVVDPFQLTGHTYQVNFTALNQTEVAWDDDGDPTTPPTMVPVNNVGWNLKDLTTGKSLLDTSKWYDGFLNAFSVDGFKIGLTGVPHWIPGKEVLSRTWIGGPSVFDPASSSYNWMLGPDFFGSALAPFDITKSVEIRLDRNKTSKGYMYLRGATPNYGYQGYFDSPVTVWDVSDPANPQQLCYAFVEQKGDKYNDNSWGPGEVTGSREYMFILDEPYRDTPDPKYTPLLPNSAVDAGKMRTLYAGWFIQNADYSQAGDPKAYKWKDGDMWRIIANIPYTPADVFEFKTVAPTYSEDVAKQDVNAVNVFPNPYLGANAQELNKYQRFVTFNHLPPEATIRVYTLAGTLVKTIQKYDPSQLINWDLRNENGLPVGSGMYIIHVDMPKLGVSKVLKLAVIMEAQFLDRI